LEIFVENLLVLSENVELFGFDSESFGGGGEFLGALRGRLATATRRTLYVITKSYAHLTTSYTLSTTHIR
jgi:hypothetical protein